MYQTTLSPVPLTEPTEAAIDRDRNFAAIVDRTYDLLNAIDTLNRSCVYRAEADGGEVADYMLVGLIQSIALDIQQRLKA